MKEWFPSALYNYETCKYTLSGSEISLKMEVNFRKVRGGRAYEIEAWLSVSRCLSRKKNVTRTLLKH